MKISWYSAVKERWLELGFGFLIGVFAGWCASAFFERATLDSGLATLLGSALGAGITVVGAMWVAAYQTSAELRAAEQYAGDATAAVRDEAYCMTRMARTEGVETLALHAAKMIETIDLLRENVKLWQSGMPYAGINNYKARFQLGKVEQKVIETMGQLRRDRSFLIGTLSQAVVENAVANLGHIGDELQEVCSEAMSALAYQRPHPTDAEFTNRIATIQEDDRILQRAKQANWE